MTCQFIDSPRDRFEVRPIRTALSEHGHIGRIEEISANTFAIIPTVFAVVVFDAPVGAPA